MFPVWLFVFIYRLAVYVSDTLRHVFAPYIFIRLFAAC